MTEFFIPSDLTGKEVALPFSAVGPRIIDLSYSQNGDLLVLCQVTNSLMVWNAHRGVALAQRRLHAPVLGGLLSRDGKHALIYFEATSGQNNLHPCVVNWSADKDVLDLPEHQGIRCLAFSGDGRLAATVDGARRNRVWDVGTGELLLSLPPSGREAVGIALDEQGAKVAAGCAQISVQGLAQINEPSVQVPDPGPKAGTIAGGAGVVLLAIASAALGDANIGWNPHWFKAPSAIGVALSDDGQRVAILNPAPNFKGEFQLRLADASTGRQELVYGLSASFLPWAVYRDSGPMVLYETPGDRTGGQPVFSRSGLQVAVPGNGVRVLDFTAAPKVNEQWLGKTEPPPAYVVGDRHEIHYLYSVEPVHAVNSVSWLARAPHRQICLEATVDASRNEGWVVPLGLGMKDVFVPNMPVSRVVNQSLRTVWQDCGHTFVEWNSELNLSSRVLRWQLECSHSLAKGWDLTAIIELELSLGDKKGTVLHCARYSGKDHQIRKWEPSDSFIGKMSERALTACLAEMKNDPKWERALTAASPISRSP